MLIYATVTVILQLLAKKMNSIIDQLTANCHKEQYTPPWGKRKRHTREVEGRGMNRMFSNGPP